MLELIPFEPRMGRNFIPYERFEGECRLKFVPDEEAKQQTETRTDGNASGQEK